MTEIKKTTQDFTTWSVYKKLAYARQKVQAGGMQKTGFHRHTTKTGQRVEYSYFELADFLPRVNTVFAEVGLCSAFRFARDGENRLIAVLDIFNADRPDEVIQFCSETAEVEMSTAIQSLGALHTYMRRYLWLEAMEIVEADMVDAPETEGEAKPAKPAKTAKPAPQTNNGITAGQMKVLKKYEGSENMNKVFEHYNVSRIEDLTMEQASATIQAFIRTEEA